MNRKSKWGISEYWRTVTIEMHADIWRLLDPLADAIGVPKYRLVNWLLLSGIKHELGLSHPTEGKQLMISQEDIPSEAQRVGKQWEAAILARDTGDVISQPKAGFIVWEDDRDENADT